MKYPSFANLLADSITLNSAFDPMLEIFPKGGLEITEKYQDGLNEKNNTRTIQSN